jgi:pimeloyl-ACP methyl ester carboxylesterase
MPAWPSTSPGRPPRRRPERRSARHRLVPGRAIAEFLFQKIDKDPDLQRQIAARRVDQPHRRVVEPRRRDPVQRKQLDQRALAQFAPDDPAFPRLDTPSRAGSSAPIAAMASTSPSAADGRALWPPKRAVPGQGRLGYRAAPTASSAPGAADRVIAPPAQPPAAWHVLDNAGHLVHMERPAEVNRLVAANIARGG